MNQITLVEPADQVVGGWVACCLTCDGYSAKAGALTAALDNVGERGIAMVLAKMKKESSLELVKWLAAK